MKAVIQPVKLCILKYGITKYLSRIAIATSIFFNTLFGGLNNQTVSARNYERRKQGLSKLCWIIDSIFGEGHCKRAWAKWTVINNAISHYDEINKQLELGDKTPPQAYYHGQRLYQSLFRKMINYTKGSKDER